jgi:TetR/AcrR family transcriptional repressor of nem operon
MARSREYDMDQVVQRAMEAFWRRGYVATSMADIYAATGLKPGSVYAAFGDKETLFRQAFEAYARHFRATLPTGSRGLQAIAEWLETQRRLAVEDPERRGCLIVNTVLERDAHTEATIALAQGRLQEIRDFFVGRLTQAMQDGELPAETDMTARADALLGTVMAIMALGRAGADGSTIGNVVRQALAGLTLPDRKFD